MISLNYRGGPKSKISFSKDEEFAIVKLSLALKKPTEKEALIIKIIGSTGRNLLLGFSSTNSIEALEKALNLPARSGRPLFKLLAGIIIETYKEDLDMIP